MFESNSLTSTLAFGPERLERLMENVIDRLRDAGAVKGEIVVCDATFIQAYSKRDPKDDSKGCSDPDAKAGRAEKDIG